MFNEITIKQSQNLLFDLGQIAESLLFYQKVNLICNVSFFKFLLVHDETDTFLELMITGKIHVQIEDNLFASMRKAVGDDNVLWYKPVLVRSENVILQERLERVIYETTQRPGYSKRLTKKILNNSELLLHTEEALDFVKQDLKDEVYLKRAISYSIKNFHPDIIVEPETIQAVVDNYDEGLLIRTNVNFNKINEQVSRDKTINDESVLINIMNTRVDSTLASKMKTDLVTSPIITTLLHEKVNNIINKTTDNQEQIDNFSDIYLHEGKKIREVLNSGERSLKEYMEVLDKADRFKEWLGNIENDENLLKEYNKAVTSETWVDKLPGKSLRWTVFTGLGLTIDLLGAGGIGTAISTAISAGDAFLLDKLIDGWKPNTFVNGELDKFIKSK